MNKNKMKTTFKIKVNNEIRNLTKKQIQELYEEGKIKPLGFVEQKYDSASGYDILYMDDNNVILADNFTKKIYVPKKQNIYNDIKFIIDGVFYSLTKQVKVKG